MLSPAARALIYNNRDFTFAALERLSKLIASHIECRFIFRNGNLNTTSLGEEASNSKDQESQRLGAHSYVTNPLTFISEKFEKIINELRKFRNKAK